MAFSTEKIIDDLYRVQSYADYLKVVKYINSHEGDFSPSDYDILIDTAQEILEKKFNPKECSQIKNIYYLSKTGYTSKEWTPFGRNTAIGYCSEAQDLHIPLHEYLFDLYPDMQTFKVEMMQPSSYERELARPIFKTPEERRPSRIPPTQPPEAEAEAGITRVEVNVPELVNRLRDDMEEMFAASRSENRQELERLRKEINGLYERLESRPSTGTKEITRVLDTAQYGYYVKNLPKLRLPTAYEKVARGQYQVKIQVKNQEEEQKALAFLSEAEAQESVSRASVRVRPPGFDEVLDLLCKNYEKHSGMACGLSRTGALSTLAERLVEYAISQGTEWDKLFDIYSMDLFARKGKIYSREQGDEAFNNAVAQVEAKGLKSRREEEENRVCSPEVMGGYVLDYDAMNLIITDKLLPSIPPELYNLRDEAVNMLTECGYYPNGLDRLRDEADAEYRSYGTSYDDQLDATVQSYIKRYRQE